MKIRVPKMFKRYEEKLRIKTNEALQERCSLGLSIPDDFEVRIGFYSDERAYASANVTSEGKKIIISPLTLSLDYANADEQIKILQISSYFDSNRNLWGSINNDFLRLFADGEFETAIERYRGREEDVELNEQQVNQLIHYLSLIEQLKDLFLYALDSSDLSHLRHELDHVDLYSSRLYKNAVYIGERLQEKAVQLSHDADEKLIKNCKGLNEEVLKIESEFLPIFESRALFFDYVKPNEWSGFDLKSVKKQVLGNFICEYVEGSYPTQIMHRLIKIPTIIGKLNPFEVSYVFRNINLQNVKPAVWDNLFSNMVDFESVNRYVYDELPKWKRRYVNNATELTEAIGDAYRNSPSRLKDANRAKDYQEFLKICRG